eukprot:403333124
MALIFTIDQVHGNSHIGVPVFSRSAKKHNYNYLVFTSPKHNENVQSTLNIFDQPDNKKIEDDQQSQARELLKKHGLAKYANNDDKFMIQKKVQEIEMQRDKRNSPHKVKSNAAFATLSRDKYYKVHGLRTEQPKLGNIYQPRHELVEKRVTGPLYVGDINHQISKEAQNAENFRKQQFQRASQNVCDKIFQALGSTTVKHQPMATKQSSLILEQSKTRLNYSNLIAAKQGLNESNNSNNNLSGRKGYRNNLDIYDNDQSYTQQQNQGLNNTGNITAKQSMLSSVTPNKLKKTSQQFPFLNSPITDPKHSHQRNNSDYKSKSLVKPGYYILHEYPELKIFKDEVKIAEQVVPRILTRDFLRTLRRKSFVSSRDPPHYKRFDQTETVVNNKITQPKLSCLIDIGKASARDSSLILKGGNELMDISQKNAGVFYDANKDVILNKTTLQVMKFDKINHRDYQGSIYRREKSPDYYDHEKITSGFQSQSQFVTPKVMLDMKKQPGRDFTKLYASTGGEAYKNIQRENERQDWIKRLVEGKSE